MAKAQAEREAIARLDLPPDRVARARVEEYLRSANMGAKDLAAEVGYSDMTIRIWLYGRYRRPGGDTRYIRRTLLDYIEAHPIGAGTEDALPTKVLPTPDTKLLRERIDQARRHSQQPSGEPFIAVIEGPPGTSKTTVLRSVWTERNRARANDTFYIRVIHKMTGFDLLRALAAQLGANARATRLRVVTNCVRKLAAIPHPVLLVDEAQNLISNGQAEALEQLRDLLDLSRAGCVLVGTSTSSAP